MTDIKSAEDRSRNMAAIKGKDTKPEQYICHELFSLGYRYRKNVNYIEGHPDIFMRKYNTAIFVHGCFWHRHQGCKYAYVPKTRTDFWEKKFRDNKARDERVVRSLQKEKIKCLIIWECTVKKMRSCKGFNDQIMNEVIDFLEAEALYAEY